MKYDLDSIEMITNDIKKGEGSIRISPLDDLELARPNMSQFKINAMRLSKTNSSKDLYS